MRARHRKAALALFNTRMHDLAVDKEARDCLIDGKDDVLTLRGILGWNVLGLNRDGHEALLVCSGNFGQGHVDYLLRVLKRYVDGGVSGKGWAGLPAV